MRLTRGLRGRRLPSSALAPPSGSRDPPDLRSVVLHQQAGVRDRTNVVVEIIGDLLEREAEFEPIEIDLDASSSSLSSSVPEFPQHLLLLG